MVNGTPDNYRVNSEGDRVGKIDYWDDSVTAYETEYFFEYSAGSSDSFSMSGEKYYQRVVSSRRQAWGIYNLNGQYNSLSGILGHIDGESMVNGTLFLRRWKND